MQREGEFGLAGALERERENPDHGAASWSLTETGEQGVERQGEGSAGEELIAIDQIEQRHGLAAQGMDDVTVVDDMAMFAVRPGPTASQDDDGRRALETFEPIVIKAHPQPMADQSRGNRVEHLAQREGAWTNSHLYEFRIGGAGWGEPDPDGIYGGPMDAKKGRLAAVLADAGRKTFSYIYDFRDGWDHTVKLEKIAPAIDGEPTFLLLQAVGRCPPEDCGGPSGYERLLEILADPDDKEHAETLTWCGGPFDPKRADLPALEAATVILARRWSPRPRAATKRGHDQWS